MTRTDYFLVTRFNVASSFATTDPLDPVWFAHRMALFRRYCVPSVAGQSFKNFRWLLLVDKRTPEGSLAQIRAALAPTALEYGFVACDHNFKKCLRKDVVHRSSGATHIATLRLDNDDAIHRDFIADVARRFTGQKYEFVEFLVGATYDARRGRLYRRRMPNNPFLALVEEYGPNLTTVYCGNHSSLRERAAYVTLETGPRWLQIIHERNIKNKIRGYPVYAPSGVLSQFQIDAMETRMPLLTYAIEYARAVSRNMVRT